MARRRLPAPPGGGAPPREDCSMKIADFMTRDVDCVSPADTLARARAFMDRRRVNQLPVGRDAGETTAA